MAWYCLLVSCDSRISEPAEEREQKTEAEITFSQRPLVYPGDVADGRSGDLVASRAPQSGSGSAPYYCLVSTLNPEGTEYAYRYEAFDLNIPKGLIKKARRNGVDRQWYTFGLGSEAAGSRTEADPARVATQPGSLVRLSHCRIPGLPQIINTVKKTLRGFGAESWIAAEEKNTRSTTNTGGVQTGSSYCAVWEHTWWCRVYDDPTRGTECEYESTRCVEHHVYIEDDDEGGGGGNPLEEEEDNGGPGGGPSGDGGDDEMCDPDDSGGDGLVGNDGVPVSCPEEESPELPEPLNDDYVADVDTTNIVCDGSFTGTYKERESKKAWCASSPPTGERLQVTNTALDNIEQRGNECAAIAQKGRQLLQNYGLRYYPGSASSEGGWGGPQTGALLDEGWLYFVNGQEGTVVDTDGSKLKVNLEFTLVHEIEHALGDLEHVDLPNGKESKWMTSPNTVPCAGI